MQDPGIGSKSVNKQINDDETCIERQSQNSGETGSSHHG